MLAACPYACYECGFEWPPCLFCPVPFAHCALQSKEAAKGRFWFVETDLRSGTAIRMDKTGKSILMLLRHLGRLQEVSVALSPGRSASLQQAQALAVGWQCRTSKSFFGFATN